jgi:type I restriction enzyme M protein
MIEVIRKTLWATADQQRASMDVAEHKHFVFGLIFVKCISDTLNKLIRCTGSRRVSTY